MSPLSRRLPLSLGLLTAGALLFAALSARSQAPPASAAASASPSPSASASAAASGSAAPMDEIRGADIPVEPSEAPKAPEWAGGKAVRPRRDAHTPCSFSVLREWLRVECSARIGAALVVGDPADVKIWAWGDPFYLRPETHGPGLPPEATVITMRLRRGDSKVFEVIQLNSTGYGWSFPETVETLAVVWREGRPDPLILVEKSVTGFSW